jgi:5-methylcytosine-specific restriction endonuclease McrA
MAGWRTDPVRRKKMYEAVNKARGKNPDYQREYFKARPGLKALQHARRRTAELMACPSWADQEQIAAFYRNRPDGLEVDHIVPLCGRNVCGLHVPWNLQYLTRTENTRKGNRFVDV